MCEAGPVLRLQQVVVASTLKQKVNGVNLAFRLYNNIAATTFSVRTAYSVRGGDSDRPSDYYESPQVYVDG